MSDETEDGEVRDILGTVLRVPLASRGDWPTLERTVLDTGPVRGVVHVVGWGELTGTCPEAAAGISHLRDAVLRAWDSAVFTLNDSAEVLDVTIALHDVSSARGLQRLLKQELGFPDMYGHNWDAFWDAITGLVQLPGTLRFTGWAHLVRTLPDDAESLRESLERYVAESSPRPPLHLVFED
ncbi:barstar family protein [Nocardiopsis sp. FIRDI 009]|uniref:barstar family protein n=1 Tax=Nocardiopsis sp. FIRDI 009 TaxID=714197 RepID=UPI0018E56CAA|nr:barstar family protein [Nocardiopsis sp. FIRDI 009]